MEGIKRLLLNSKRKVHLHPDIWFLILQYLNLRETIILSTINKELFNITNSDIVWKYRAIIDHSKMIPNILTLMQRDGY